MQIAIFSANLVLAEKVEHFGMETLAWRVGRAGLERLDRLREADRAALGILDGSCR
jgi:hypothetical protein